MWIKSSQPTCLCFRIGCPKLFVDWAQVPNGATSELKNLIAGRLQAAHISARSKHRVACCNSESRQPNIIWVLVKSNNALHKLLMNFVNSVRFNNGTERTAGHFCNFNTNNLMAKALMNNDTMLSKRKHLSNNVTIYCNYIYIIIYTCFFSFPKFFSIPVECLSGTGLVPTNKAGLIIVTRTSCGKTAHLQG